MVDFPKVVDPSFVNLKIVHDSFLCRTTMSSMELCACMSMTKAKFMRHLDLYVDSGIRSFDEGRGFCLHEPLVEKNGESKLCEVPGPCRATRSRGGPPHSEGADRAASVLEQSDGRRASSSPLQRMEVGAGELERRRGSAIASRDAEVSRSSEEQCIGREVDKASRRRGNVAGVHRRSADERRPRPSNGIALEISRGDHSAAQDHTGPFAQSAERASSRSQLAEGELKYAMLQRYGCETIVKHIC